MSVNIGTVNTFPNVEPDKEQALKVLEESAEVFGAWQIWNDAPERYEFEALAKECADVIQATCNLLAALGVEDFTEWLQVVEEKNRDRGHYER